MQEKVNRKAPGLDAVRVEVEVPVEARAVLQAALKVLASSEAVGVQFQAEELWLVGELRDAAARAVVFGARQRARETARLRSGAAAGPAEESDG